MLFALRPALRGKNFYFLTFDPDVNWKNNPSKDDKIRDQYFLFRMVNKKFKMYVCDSKISKFFRKMSNHTLN